MIYALDGIRPLIHADTWVAQDANLIGRVVLEAGASVWFGATLRGDNEEIRVGAGSNVQENAVLHTDMGYPLIIGANCTIGHKALITEGKEIPDGSLVMGAPGKVIRQLDDEARARLLRSALNYQANMRRFRAGLTVDQA
jgi:carbonic anhydrase/acetyltransferase-like protein (isoleucine patch superfamily)